jgi:hypothetical protein
MPKMYRIIGGASYTWEYVFTPRDDGSRGPGETVLAKSTERFESEGAAEDAIKEMKGKTVKRMGDKP